MPLPPAVSSDVQCSVTGDGYAYFEEDGNLVLILLSCCLFGWLVLILWFHTLHAWTHVSFYHEQYSMPRIYTVWRNCLYITFFSFWMFFSSYNIYLLCTSYMSFYNPLLPGPKSCDLFNSSFYSLILSYIFVMYLHTISISTIMFSPARIAHNIQIYIYHGFLQRSHNEVFYFVFHFFPNNSYNCIVFLIAAALTWYFHRAICYDPEISFLSNNCQLSTHHCIHKNLSLFFTNRVQVPVAFDP